MRSKDKSKKKQEDNAQKNERNKVPIPIKKRGLFENGFLSKPIVKGTFDACHNARLAGNLEGLLQEDPSCSKPSCSKLTFPSSDIDDEDDGGNDVASNVPGEENNNIIKKNEAEIQVESITQNSLDLYKEWVRYDRDDLKEDSHNDIEKSGSECINDANIDEPKKTILNIIQQGFDRLRAAMEKACPESGEQFFQNFKKERLKRMQDKLIKQILIDDKRMLAIINEIYEEFLESKRADTVDKIQQVNDSDFKELTDENMKHLSTKYNVNCEKENNTVFVFPSPKASSEKNFNFSKGPTNFFDTIEDTIPSKKFDFIPKVQNNSMPITMSPQRKINSQLFARKLLATPENTIDCKKYNLVPSAKKKKGIYFPAIISPPSPGRNYSPLPIFLQERQWAHKIKRLDFPSVRSLSNDVALGSDKKQEFQQHSSSSSSGNLFLFPKRPKVVFSPHRM